ACFVVCIVFSFFLVSSPPLPRSTLFPYTTLFRSFLNYHPYYERFLHNYLNIYLQALTIHRRNASLTLFPPYDQRSTMFAHLKQFLHVLHTDQLLASSPFLFHLFYEYFIFNKYTYIDILIILLYLLLLSYYF